jgi:hypothetical protein
VTDAVSCLGLSDCPGSEGVPGNNPRIDRTIFATLKKYR